MSTTEHTPSPAAAAGPADTRKEITRLSARGYSQYRHVLFQLPQGENPRGSTVGRLLAARKHRALVLYLLLLTCWPWLRGRRSPLEAAVWIRALTTDTGLTWSPSTLSRAWKDLEEAGLISRHREGRTVRVVPRREDGAGDYTLPEGRSDRWNTYFVLPDDFWHDELFATLTFPGLAMLLIIAGETSDKPEIDFAYDWARDRYGVSAKSAQNGIKELRARGLIHRREVRITAALSATGFTTRTYYSLTGQYGQEARNMLQKRAKTERAKRIEAAGTAKTAAKAGSRRKTVKKAAGPKRTRARGTTSGTAPRTTRRPSTEGG